MANLSTPDATSGNASPSNQILTSHARDPEKETPHRKPEPDMLTTAQSPKKVITAPRTADKLLDGLRQPSQCRGKPLFKASSQKIEEYFVNTIGQKNTVEFCHGLKLVGTSFDGTSIDTDKGYENSSVEITYADGKKETIQAQLLVTSSTDGWMDRLLIKSNRTPLDSEDWLWAQTLNAMGQGSFLSRFPLSVENYRNEESPVTPFNHVIKENTVEIDSEKLHYYLGRGILYDGRVVFMSLYPATHGGIKVLTPYLTFDELLTGNQSKRIAPKNLESIGGPRHYDMDFKPKTYLYAVYDRDRLMEGFQEYYERNRGKLANDGQIPDEVLDYAYKGWDSSLASDGNRRRPGSRW